MKKSRTWLLTFAAVSIAAGIAVTSVTVHVDPFMHYHKPLTDQYFYALNNERSQNDGITKHFDYDGIITGTSMTENFRTSEADRIFDADFIKVPYSGGTFKEINDNLATGLRTHPKTQYIIRCLDRYLFDWDKDSMRTDMGIDFPTYLYDQNPLNDTKYVFNRDVIYSDDYNMIQNHKDGTVPGITSFDDYANWMSSYTFGNQTVLHTVFTDDTSYEQGFHKAKKQVDLTNKEKQTIHDNVIQNVTDLADQYPNTSFYYFLPPYSAAYWGGLLQEGQFERQIQLEKYAVSLILPHKNIHLFMWNRFDLTDDLNNYKDNIHYGEWINTWMLEEMKKDDGRLKENDYKSVIDKEAEHYRTFDYSTLFRQKDYEADYYASGLLNKEISGTEPVKLEEDQLRSMVHHADVISDQYEGTTGIECHGTMKRNPDDTNAVSVAMKSGDYSGISYTFDASDYRAFTWWGKKIRDHGQVTAYVYDTDGNMIRSIETQYQDLDDQWHQYALNLDGIYGKVTVIINGAYTDSTGSKDSEYIFSDIVLY